MARTKNGKRQSDAPRSDASYLPATERRAKGMAVRDAVPPASHAGWKLAMGRRDPTELPAESSAGRVQTLDPIRFGLMAEPAVAF